MTSENASPKRVGPRQWPGMWARDESFWRSVIGEALGALIAALIIYLFALAAGYVTRPDVWPVVLTLSVAALGWSGAYWLGRRDAAARARRYQDILEQTADEDPLEQFRLLISVKAQDRRRTTRRALIAVILGSLSGIIVSAYQLLP